MSSLTDRRTQNRNITVALGYEEFNDCESCGWRIMRVPAWKVFFTDIQDDYSKYNHSIIREVMPARRGYDVVVSPWNRKPGDPEEVILEEVFYGDMRQADGGGVWEHVSPHHPSFLPKEEQEGKVCTFASPSPRCPKCNSLKIQYSQLPYGNATDCPECKYHSYYSIGD